EQGNRSEMEGARRAEGPALAEAHRDRRQPLRAVDLEVEQRIEQVEPGHPERDGAAERPRLPRDRAGDRRPGPDRGEPVDRPEPEVAEPGPALQVRVDDEARDRDRPEPVDKRVELVYLEEEVGQSSGVR